MSKISRYLEQFLDEEGWLGDSYVLEVSSPGSEPSAEAQTAIPEEYQYSKWRASSKEESKEGTLVAVGEEEITIEAKVREDGKRKKCKSYR